MLQAGMMAALVISGVAGVGMMGNEMTHGGLSEMMGLGHNHMSDVGGYHCSSHAQDPADHHVEHMHGDNYTAHADCAGGAGMHQGMGGMGGP